MDRHLRELAAENERLKRLVAEQALDIQMLKDELKTSALSSAVSGVRTRWTEPPDVPIDDEKT
jgi:hypothetical protein